LDGVVFGKVIRIWKEEYQHGKTILPTVESYKFKSLNQGSDQEIYFSYHQYAHIG